MVTFKKIGHYGRLGNQLFQIASTVGIALENNSEYVFPLWEYSKYFANPVPQVNINELNETNYHLAKEMFFSYYYIVTNGKNVDLEGYFQTEKYFEKHKDKIKEHFTLKDRFLKEIKHLDTIKDKLTCSVHIRRGDYLGLPHVYNELTIENYYENAMAQFPDETLFLVFSDDIEWCKENIKKENVIFVEGQSDIYDLILMSKCSHNIIANSSFSWWGAWLNNNPDKKVIAPGTWFSEQANMPTQDLIPEAWTKLDTK